MNNPEETAQEIEFYGQLVQQFKEASSQSLLNKRAAIAKEDPTEEIIELHLEIQQFEKQFKECVEIASYMLDKNRELDQVIHSSANMKSMQSHQNESKQEIATL